jgi:uncharacterized protein YndB with AHSA1/START domain
VTATETPTLRLERTFDAPAEAVFDAWTNPEVLRRWWVAESSWRTAEAQVDLRVGGGYRLSMEDPAADHLHTVRGEYREVRRPERLVYSWAWEEADGRLGHESTVAVDFIGDGETTTVVLEHTGLASLESRDAHRSGWEGCLSNLRARVLAAAAQPS